MTVTDILDDGDVEVGVKGKNSLGKLVITTVKVG